MMGLWFSRNPSEATAETLSNGFGHALRMLASRNLGTALTLSTRLLCYAALGMFFSLSTKGEDFTCSLRAQLRLPASVCYSILAGANLLPHMAREYRSVLLAFRARGMKASPLSRKVLFAMLVNSIRWSDSVSMAMESKGFDSHGKRSYLHSPKTHIRDWLFLVLAPALLLFAIAALSK